MKGPVLAQEKIVEALESVIVSGDRIVMEGDNQKEADFCPDPWFRSMLRRSMTFTSLSQASAGLSI
jgi:hypothetical protein